MEMVGVHVAVGRCVDVQVRWGQLTAAMRWPGQDGSVNGLALLRRAESEALSQNDVESASRWRGIWQAGYSVGLLGTRQWTLSRLRKVPVSLAEAFSRSLDPKWVDREGCSVYTLFLNKDYTWIHILQPLAWRVTTESICLLPQEARCWDIKGSGSLWTLVVYSTQMAARPHHIQSLILIICVAFLN